MISTASLKKISLPFKIFTSFYKSTSTPNERNRDIELTIKYVTMCMSIDGIIKYEKKLNVEMEIYFVEN